MPSYFTPTVPTMASSVPTSSNNVSNEDLLKLIRDLQHQMNMQNKTPMQKTPTKRIVSHYCWTYGACGHPSNLCRNQKQGHQDKATFQDKMGGSVSMTVEWQQSSGRRKETPDGVGWTNLMMLT